MFKTLNHVGGHRDATFKYATVTHTFQFVKPDCGLLLLNNIQITIAPICPPPF